MSTRIYNGYRLPGDTNVPALCRDLNERMREPYRESAITAVAMTALLLMTVKSEPEPSTGEPISVTTEVMRLVSNDQLADESLTFDGHNMPLIFVAAQVIDKAQEVLRRPYPRWLPSLFDLSLSVVFLSDPEDERYLYALLYSELAAYDRAWQEIPGVEPYFYWNNTDAPDEIEKAEWSKRAEVWKRILGHSTPAEVGIEWKHRPIDLAWEVMAFNGNASGKAWLTAPMVADRLIGLSKKPERFQHDELVERLNGNTLGKTEIDEAD